MARKVAIIASQPGSQTAYKVLNIAMAAIASEAEVKIFFTFEGLRIIHRDADFGPGQEDSSDRFAALGIPSIAALLTMAVENGVQLIGCQMTMDLMGFSLDDLVDGVEVGGAMTFLDFAYDADVTMTF